MSTFLWTCPQKCGHYPNTNFICKIAVMHTCQILTLATSYGMLFRIIAKKLQIEHISSCRIAHMSTTKQSTKMCCRYIYMTAVNVHRSNLRKAGVLKLLQDKNQLLIKSLTLVIVLTYLLTNPLKFLNTAFFLKLQWCAL